MRILFLFLLISLKYSKPIEIYGQNESNIFQLDSAFYFIQNYTLNKLSKSLFGEEINILEYPSQGNYPWYFETNNGYFNQWTYNYLSSRLTKSSIPYALKMESPGSFINAYSQLLSSIYYNLSTGDVIAINKFNLHNQILIDSIVTQYEAIFSTITATDLNKAQAYCGNWKLTNIDYILQYIVGGIWSGRIKKNEPPLTFNELLPVPDLDKILVDIPSKAKPLLPNINKYLHAVSTIAEIEDKRSQNAWMLRNVNNNLTLPNTVNGGTKLINPIDGAISNYEVSYQVNPSVSQLIHQFDSSQVDVSISVTCDVSGQYKVNSSIFQGKKLLNSTNYSISIDSGLYLTSYIGFQPTTFSINMNGLTMIKSNMLSWNIDKLTGWFNPSILVQSIQNINNDRTGFKFSISPAFNFEDPDQGGDLGFISHLMVCQQYEVSFQYRTSSVKKKIFKGKRTPLVLANSQLVASITKNSRNKGFQITFNSNSGPITVPQLQKKAYVMGIGALFPPDW